MAPRLIPADWNHFILNLLLQAIDGILTYQVLSLGVSEANPFVATAIDLWGEVWGLLYWKLFACRLLMLIFTLRHRRRALTIRALTVTSSVYGFVALAGFYELVAQLGL